MSMQTNRTGWCPRCGKPNSTPDWTICVPCQDEIRSACAPRLASVISVRGRKPAELLKDPRFVYCARAEPRAGWSRSPWANPFTVRAYGDRAVHVYERTLRHLLTGDMDRHGPAEWWTLLPADQQWFRQGAERLEELIGKTLGCWCGNWQPGQPAIQCHAWVLATIVNEWEEASQRT